jgi:hypothetical protein
MAVPAFEVVRPGFDSPLVYGVRFCARALRAAESVRSWCCLLQAPTVTVPATGAADPAIPDAPVRDIRRRLRIPTQRFRSGIRR